MVTNNSCNYSPTQFDVQAGGASGTLQSVSPGTAGEILVSGGAAALPAFSATLTVTSITFGAGTPLSVYQQGTFTPGLSFGGGSTGITYSAVQGTYTRIGNLCYVQGFVNLSSKGSSTGTAALTGLPFTVNASLNPVGQFGPTQNGPTPDSGYVSIITQFLAGTTTATFIETATADGDSQNMTDTNFTNTSEFYFSGFYQI